MYDMQGRIVKTWQEGFDQLDIGEFVKGVYVLNAFTKDKVYRNKLVYNKD
jgi:hypothetical protein